MRGLMIGRVLFALFAGAALSCAADRASIGSNYMLNVGPDPLGRFPVAAIDILDELAKAR